MKKIIIPFLVLAFCIFTLFPSLSSASASGSTTSSGVIDLNNLEQLKESGEVTDRELTYEEMIQFISSNEGIAENKVREMHPDPNTKKIGTRATVQSTTLHEIKIRQSVTSSYKPAVQIFVYMTGSGSFWQYDKLYDADLDRKDASTGTSKQYQGKLKVEIQSKNRIFYLINGDFYNNGTTTITGSVTASGVVWSGTGEISNQSNHYKYWNNSGYKDIQ